MNPMFYSLLAFTAVFAAATTNALTPVLDVNGDPIFGGSYYAVPRNFVEGGGLILAGRVKKPCPLNIGQSPSEVEKGIPVKFSNWLPRVAFVPESQNLNIEMDVASICMQPTYWKLEMGFVTTGPKPEGFGGAWSASFFQIRKAEDGYRFVFCSSDAECTNVGIIQDDEDVRRVALGGSPLEVVFVKSTDDSTKTMSIV